MIRKQVLYFNALSIQLKKFPPGKNLKRETRSNGIINFKTRFLISEEKKTEGIEGN